MMHHEAPAIAGEIEPIHQMRVATRRLRAAVQLFAGVIHGSRVQVYKRDLPWLGRAAGAVRECDMIEALIRETGARLDSVLADALTPLCDRLALERKAAHARFVEELRSRRYQRMCERLADPLLRHALPAIDAACDAPAMLAPLARSLRKAGKRVARDAPPELFHRLRVRIKRMRYALEMLAEVGGKRSRKALNRLEQMQELLGAHQDMVSTIAWLRGFAADADGVAPQTLMAVGAMLQALIVRRPKLAARAYRRWRKIVRSGVLKDTLEEISQAAEARAESVHRAQAEAANSTSSTAGTGASDATAPRSDDRGADPASESTEDSRPARPAPDATEAVNSAAAAPTTPEPVAPPIPTIPPMDDRT